MSDSKALAIVPRSLPEVSQLAEVLAKSTLLPEALRGKVPDIIVSILAGQELGLAPMAAIRGVFVIQGKPMLAADTMVALVLGSGLAEYFSCVEDTDQRVTYETKRRGSPHAQKISWTTEDTKRAALTTKENWRMYPRAMMKARCKAALARDVYPDILAGVYDPDEVPAPTRITVPDAIDAEIVDPLADALAAIGAAKTTDELLKLTGMLGKLSEPGKTTARERYKSRAAELAPPVVNGTEVHEAS